jgi:hypothetical protein
MQLPYLVVDDSIILKINTLNFINNIHNNIRYNIENNIIIPDHNNIALKKFTNLIMPQSDV